MCDSGLCAQELCSPFWPVIGIVLMRSFRHRPRRKSMSGGRRSSCCPPMGSARVRSWRDHGADGQVEDLRLALARAVHGRGRRWLAARKVAPSRHPEDGGCQGGRSEPPHAGCAAAGRDALDAAGDGRGRPAGGFGRTEDLGCRASGKRTALRRTAGGSSSCRTIRLLPKSCRMVSGFMWHLPPIR